MFSPTFQVGNNLSYLLAPEALVLFVNFFWFSQPILTHPRSIFFLPNLKFDHSIQIFGKKELILF